MKEEVLLGEIGRRVGTAGDRAIYEVEYETQSRVRKGDALVAPNGLRLLVLTARQRERSSWLLHCWPLGPLDRVKGNLHTLEPA